MPSASDPALALIQQQVEIMKQIQMQMQMQTSSGSQGPAPSQGPTIAAPEVHLPSVGISNFAKTWKHPEGEKAIRVNCPYKLFKTFTFDLEGFEQWLPRHTKVKQKCSINATKGNLERFFQLLEFEAGADPKGILCQCLNDSIIQQLRELPIMHKQYSWPKTIMNALDHYIKFLAMKCNQARPRQSETRNTLLQLNEEVVQGYKGEDCDQRLRQNKEKKRRDTKRLTEQWPETADIKASVKQAMVDLQDMAQRYDGSTKMKAQMNCLVIAIIHYNEFAGRSGEWAKLSAAHVHSQFASGKNVLICQDHKTAEVYGDVGKPLSPGTKKAMEIYDSAFQGEYQRENDLFFQPCSGKQVSISYYLSKFGRDNWPELPAPNSNLIRKQFASVTDAHASRNECFKMMEAFDKHGEATMRKAYICKSAEQDAEYGFYIFREVYGDPVPWPTPEEHQQMRRKMEAVGEEEDTEEEEEEEATDEEEGEEEQGDEEDEEEGPEEEGDEEDEEEGPEEVEEDEEAKEEDEEDEKKEASDETKDGEGDEGEGHAGRYVDVDMGAEAAVPENEEAEEDGKEKEAAEMEVDAAAEPENQEAEMKVDAAAVKSYEDILAAFCEDADILAALFETQPQDSRNEVEELDQNVQAVRLLHQTAASYSLFDDIETAASKAAHCAATEAATRVYARAKPSEAAGVNEVFQRLTPAAPKADGRVGAQIKSIEDEGGQQILKIPRSSAHPVQIPMRRSSADPEDEVAAVDERAKQREMVKGTPEQQQKWESYYDRDEAGSIRRSRVPPEAHRWMEAELAQWQKDHNKKIYERPPHAPWYNDKRCECIDAGVGLRKSHNKDVVRSWLKSQCDKAEAAAKAQKMTSQDID